MYKVYAKDTFPKEPQLPFSFQIFGSVSFRRQDFPKGKKLRLLDKCYAMFEIFICIQN